MEIKDFVSETLAQINDALEEAGKRTGKTHAVSNGTTTSSKGVSFSLAVTNVESKEHSGDKKGGVHIKVVEANVGRTNKESVSSESISRIDFNVLIY